jgi:hypothetical protein
VKNMEYGVRVMVFNTTFNNISVILWRSVLLVKETKLPREINGPVIKYESVSKQHVSVDINIPILFVLT